MVDEHLGAGLAVAVDAAVALLQAGGREGNLHVDHAVAVALQVDALAGGVGGQQDAQGPHRRVVLELGLDALPGQRVHAAVEQGQALSLVAGQAPGSHQLLQVRLGVAVLAEHDHPLVVPPALAGVVGLRAGLRQPVQEPLRLGVGPPPGGSGPGGHGLQQLPLLGRGGLTVAGRGGQGLLGGLVQLGVGVHVVLQALKGRTQGTRPGVRCSGGHPGGSGQAAQGGHVQGQGVGEGGRGGEQALLQQQGHELGGGAGRRAVGLAGAQGGVGGQVGVGLALLGRVVDLQRDDHSGREAGTAVGVGGQLGPQLGLEPADHHLCQLGRRGFDPPGEALGVE